MSHTGARGLDKEIEERIRDKYDPALEQKAMDWIAVLTRSESPKVLGNDGAALFNYLKSGVLLCEMLNNISPGIIPSSRITKNPRNMLEERGNIEQYLVGCKRLSIPSQDTFILSDLHSAKSISSVLQNIYAVGRQAQVIPGFNGPILGVKYNISIAEQQRRLKVKQQEKLQSLERKRAVSEQQLARRSELERDKRIEIIADMETSEKRKLTRQLSRGSISKSTFKKMSAQSAQRFSMLKESDTEVVTNSDIKYGMDIEIHEKRKNNYSFQKEEQAMDWLEAVTKEEINDFYEDLKSGVILCKLINCIYPNIVKSVGKKNLPLVHRDNIQMYISACARIKVRETFNVSDLYEKKDLGAVVGNIFALGDKAAFAPTYRGPSLKLNGEIAPHASKQHRRSASSPGVALKIKPAPKWEPDAATDKCRKCDTKFSVTFRRHHCRCCGKIFCSPCSRSQTPLPEFGMNNPVRVCDACFCAVNGTTPPADAAKSGCIIC